MPLGMKYSPSDVSTLALAPAEWGYRPQAQRFVGDCARDREPVDRVDVRRHVRQAEDIVGFPSKRVLPLGSVAEFVNRPGQGERRCVLAGDEHRDEVGHDRVVGERLAVLVDRQDHRFQKVRGPIRALGTGFETLARLPEQTSEPFAHRSHCVVQPAVAREPDVAPYWNGGEEALAHPRQDDFQVTLNDIVRRFDGVGVVPKSDQHCDVDREALHFVDHVQRLAGRGGSVPPAFEATGDGFEVGIELLEITLRERGHGEFALRAPSLALGVEDPLDAQFRQGLVKPGAPPERLRPGPEDFVDHRSVACHHDRSPPPPKSESWPILLGPAFENEMGLREIDLMRVAENRTGPRTWELVQRSLACRLRGSRRQSGHVDENDAVALDGGAGCETFRSAVTLAGLEREAPTMIAADEPVAFDFALAEQRALMGTTALEGAPAGAGADERQVDAVGRYGKRTVAGEIL